MAFVASYTGSRPSVRSIAASATRTNERNIPQTPSANTGPLDAYSVSDAEATRILKERRPELFYDLNQIRNQVIKEVGSRNDFGKSTRSKYIEEGIRNKIRSNQLEREDAMKPIYRELQMKARTEAKAKLEADAQKSREELAQRTSDVASGKNSQKYYANDKEFERTLNYLEAYEGVQLRQNPELYEGFKNYVSFSQQLTSMTPEQRDQTLADIKAEAAAEVDPYWDREEERVKEDLRTTLKFMDEQFGLFKEGEKFQLDQKIDGLSREAAEALSNKFLDMKRRGVLDSGIAMTLANTIIEGKTRGEDFEKAISDFRMREETMKNEYNVDKVRTSGNRALEDLGFGREADEKQLFFGLLGEEEARTFLEQYPSASRLQTYGTQETGAPTSLSTTRLGSTATLPTATAKAGSSLDLARQQAAGTISVEQQRQLRDQLLNPTITPTPKKTTTTTTSSRTPTSPVAPRTAITASSMPGSTLLQRAAARGAARTASRSV